MVIPVGKPHLVQSRAPNASRFLLRDLPGHDQPFRDILQGRLIGEQIVILKHEARAPAQPGDLLFSHAAEGIKLSVKGHGSRVRRFQEIHAPKQRGLSRAAGAHDSDHVSPVHRQIHAF